MSVEKLLADIDELAKEAVTKKVFVENIKNLIRTRLTEKQSLIEKIGSLKFSMDIDIDETEHLSYTLGRNTAIDQAQEIIRNHNEQTADPVRNDYNCEGYRTRHSHSTLGDVEGGFMQKEQNELYYLRKAVEGLQGSVEKLTASLLLQGKINEKLKAKIERLEQAEMKRKEKVGGQAHDRAY